MSSLELRHIEKVYGEYHALKDIQLSIAPGEFVVMVGPSGCGKSTLLKVIAGLEDIQSGEVHIGGRDVTRAEPSDRGIAMVFQSYALYPHMTVEENMGFGLRMAKRPKEEIAAATRRAAEILRLTDQMDKLPRQLSGGQRQRVAIGRAITRSPEVFLFDEPLSNLDAALRTQMRVELSALHAKLGATMVYVTHDQIEAMTMADRIVVMNAGRIEQAGSPIELYRNPANRFVAGFLGAPRMNFFSGDLLEVNGAEGLVEAPGVGRFVINLADKAISPGPITIGIRPEALRRAGPEDTFAFPCTVQLVEHLGREAIIYVDASPLKAVGSDTGTSHLTMHLPEATDIGPGTPMSLTFSPDNAYAFGGEGELTLTAPKSN